MRGSREQGADQNPNSLSREKGKKKRANDLKERGGDRQKGNDVVWDTKGTRQKTAKVYILEEGN